MSVHSRTGSSSAFVHVHIAMDRHIVVANEPAPFVVDKEGVSCPAPGRHLDFPTNKEIVGEIWPCYFPA